MADGRTGRTGRNAAAIAEVATRCARAAATEGRPTASERRRRNAPATWTLARHRGAAGPSGRPAPYPADKAPDPVPGSVHGTASPTPLTAAADLQK